MGKFWKLLLAIILLLCIIFIVASKWMIGTDKDIEYNTNTPQFIHGAPEEVIRKIEAKEEGIYYFGFATCPWCIEFLPILDDALATTNQKAYVVDTRDARFTDNLVNRLELVYTQYHDGELSVPFLVVISEDTSMKTHVGTLENHDAYTEKLTGRQKEELEELLVAIFQ